MKNRDFFNNAFEFYESFKLILNYHYPLPASVNGTLSAELFMKALITYEGKNFPKEHDLTTLFELLLTDTQNDIIELTSKYASRRDDKYKKLIMYYNKLSKSSADEIQIKTDLFYKEYEKTAYCPEGYLCEPLSVYGIMDSVKQLELISIIDKDIVGKTFDEQELFRDYFDFTLKSFKLAFVNLRYLELPGSDFTADLYFLFFFGSTFRVHS